MAKQTHPEAATESPEDGTGREYVAIETHQVSSRAVSTAYTRAKQGNNPAPSQELALRITTPRDNVLSITVRFGILRKLLSQVSECRGGTYDFRVETNR